MLAQIPPNMSTYIKIYEYVLKYMSYLSMEDGWFVEFKSIFFGKLNFVVLFPFLIKYYYILFIILAFWLGCDRPSGFRLFLPLCFFPYSRLSSYHLRLCVLAVPMRECFGKYSCMSSPCPIAILNGTLIFSRGEIVCNLGRSFVYENQIKLN